MSRSDGLPGDMFRRLATRAAGPLTLDEATASRLLAGAIDPADAPPGYAPVAAVLAAAAGPVRAEELTGPPPTLAAVDPSRSEPPRRGRSLRLVALVGVGVVALGGMAAAATGSLPGGAQSVAHDALGAVGVSVPAPTRAATPRAAATRPPTHHAPRVVAPRPPVVVPRHPVLHPTLTPRPGRVPTVPAPTRPPPTRGPPTRPAIGAALCRAAAAGRLSPTATGRAGLAYRSLVGLAHGAANIAAYCAQTLG